MELTLWVFKYWNPSALPFSTPTELSPSSLTHEFLTFSLSLFLSEKGKERKGKYELLSHLRNPFPQENLLLSSNFFYKAQRLGFLSLSIRRN